MADWREYPAITVNGESLALGDLLRSAWWHDELLFMRRETDALLTRQEAQRRGITVSAEELQEAADAYRRERGLHRAADTNQWLASRNATVAEFERFIEAEALARKVRAAVTEGLIERHFAENKPSFDQATLAHLVVGEEGVAEELRAQIAEEGADFYTLARQHSTDEATRGAGGYLGRMKRTALSAAAEAAVFGARPGSVVGPIKSDQGWHLIRVEALHPAALDEETRAAIQSLLFQEWLAAQRKRSAIRSPLLEEL